MAAGKAHVRAIGVEESFTLRVLRLASACGRVVDVPLVNGWVQIGLPVREVPNLDEQRIFFADLEQLVAALRRAGVLEHWYFLHKAPGLRLRFSSKRLAAADDDERGANVLIETIDEWLGAHAWGWSAPPSFDSYFEQRELFSGLHVDVTTDILTRSADARLACARDGRTTDTAGWTAFTIAFLHRFLPDTWWVWEALGRFARLRGAPLEHAGAPTGPLADPSRLLATLEAVPAPPTFAASVALLTCLNYVYNQWELDLPAQQRVLATARQLTQPELAAR